MRHALIGLAVCALILSGQTVEKKPALKKPAIAKKELPDKTPSITTDVKQPSANVVAKLQQTRDAVLEMKAAVDVGINYRDYMSKVQRIAGEVLKLKDANLSGGTKETIATQACYESIMDSYQSAAIGWDLAASDPDDPLIKAAATQMASSRNLLWSVAADMIQTDCFQKPKPPVKS